MDLVRQQQQVGDLHQHPIGRVGDELPLGGSRQPDPIDSAFLVALPMATKHPHHVGRAHLHDSRHGLPAADDRGDAGDQREKAGRGPPGDIGSSATPASRNLGQGIERAGRQVHRVGLLSAIDKTQVRKARGRDAVCKQRLVGTCLDVGNISPPLPQACMIVRADCPSLAVGDHGNRLDLTRLGYSPFARICTISP